MNPVDHVWWLSARASGIVALVLMSVSVCIGLAMATRLWRGKRPAKLHEHTANAALVAIGAHGLTLLGDPWLHPGPLGISVPFAIGYRPLFVACGIVGGYLAALLGLSFYARRRVGARRWRKAHRFVPVAWLLGVIHTLGAGSDASQPWLLAIVLAPVGVVAGLLALRLRGRSPAAAAA